MYVAGEEAMVRRAFGNDGQLSTFFQTLFGERLNFLQRLRLEINK